MKKICIIGILILLTLIPISSAIDVSNNVDIESYENPVTSPMNDDVEIISFFSGACEFINAKGLVINEPIDIWPGGFGFDISGLKQPVLGNLNIFFSVGHTPENVRASRFIGIVHEVQFNFFKVWGIALGDIEWS